MGVRVRYAPSPTGRLHLGGARTALFCHLFAKARGGALVLRIEDTDRERSDPGLEGSLAEDLAWLGVVPDEGPGAGGPFGPYRQSERLGLYRGAADDLVERGAAYPCFLSQAEIEELTDLAVRENLPPHAHHGRSGEIPREEAGARVRGGEPHAVRFRNPGGTWTVEDRVRGRVSWDSGTVGDFVLLRTDGTPVYNFCCAVDDALMEITHVIRADDHLNNTVRQLMIYDAMGRTPPEFAHCSLITGPDGKKLSKRHGARAVSEYREEGYLPGAVANHLCLLGWSPPGGGDVFNVDSVASSFSLSKLSPSPAACDTLKLKNLNGQHMRALGDEDLVGYLSAAVDGRWPFDSQSPEWKRRICRLLAPRMDLPREINGHLGAVFGGAPEDSPEYREAMALPTTPAVRERLAELAREGAGGDFPGEDEVAGWLDDVKRGLGVKGRALFLGARAVLTGRGSGPDLKALVSLTPRAVLRRRLEAGAGENEGRRDGKAWTREGGGG